MASTKGPRYQIEVQLPPEMSKTRFNALLEDARQLLTPPGRRRVDNYGLLTRLIRLAKQYLQTTPQRQEQPPPRQISWQESSGIYTEDNDPSDQYLFVCERKAFTDLCAGLMETCSCLGHSLWKLESFIQKGHAGRSLFCCSQCKQQTRTWASSRVFGGGFLVNQKLVHAFTCAGILPQHYIKMCKFADMGVTGKWYIDKVYGKRAYKEVVEKVCEESMQRAVEQVKTQPNYTTLGEWVITDARHDSTANAYHTTVPCLAGSTHRIVGITTLSRKEHTTAQTREFECTKIVIPQVTGRGLDVTEVAHDYQLQIRKYLEKEVHCLNSFDTWHGTKNVAKMLKKVCVGTVAQRGKTWFPEFTDKSMLHNKLL